MLSAKTLVKLRLLNLFELGEEPLPEKGVMSADLKSLMRSREVELSETLLNALSEIEEESSLF